MNEFLNSVKSDLLDRRLMPLVALVAAALLAALAYALLGGGSGSPTASVGPAPVKPNVSSLTVAPAPATPAEAVAETTSGAVVQRSGKVRDPFNLLPGSVQASTTASTGSTTASSGSSGGSSSGTSSTGGTGGTNETSSSAPSKGTTPAKHRVLYQVELEFGELPAGTTPATATLKPYKLTKPTALPNAHEKRIELVAVSNTKNGKGALFLLNGEVILHGPATCLPSSTQCEAIKLQEGKSEQLEFLPANGGPSVTYEVRVLKISPVAVTASAARRIGAAQARAVRTLLAPQTGALRYSKLRFAAEQGAFVPGHEAFAAASH